MAAFIIYLLTKSEQMFSNIKKGEQMFAYEEYKNKIKLIVLIADR